MKLTSGIRLIRHALPSALVLSALMAAPLASASTSDSSHRHHDLFQSRERAVEINQAEVVYDRLRTASRNICGSTSLQVAGSLRTTTRNEACFQGTLEAAVKRLGDPAVTALHRQHNS